MTDAFETSNPISFEGLWTVRGGKKKHPERRCASERRLAGCGECKTEVRLTSIEKSDQAETCQHREKGERPSRKRLSPSA